MGGWAEEVYFSMYQLAKCVRYTLGDDQPQFDHKVAPLYLDAYRFRPTRLEALYDLVVYYVNRSEFTKAFAYGMLAYPMVVQKKPITDILFVTPRVYTTDFARVMKIAVQHIPRFRQMVTSLM